MGIHHSRPAFRALLLGLDSAGKTTLLKGLTNQEISEGPTTTHNVGNLKLPKGDALVFDLGGQQKLITFWRQYYSGTGIILFVIDSSDIQRVSNAKEELYRLIYEDELIGIPLLVIANKQDMAGALSPEDIAAELELEYLAPREVHIVGACAKSKQGFAEITAWVQAHAVTVANLPRYLHSYNQQLTQLQKQKHQEHIARVNATVSRRASLASTAADESSKVSNPLASPSSHPDSGLHPNNSSGGGAGGNGSGLQLHLTDDPASTTTQPHTNGNATTTAPPISPKSQSSHFDFQSPHTDPQSTSVQSSSLMSTPRRPRLTVSIEQQVLQSHLHQQLLAQVGSGRFGNNTAHLSSNEEVNKDGIPISMRHVDEFNPGKDDVVLEAPIITNSSKRSSALPSSAFHHHNGNGSGNGGNGSGAYSSSHGATSPGIPISPVVEETDLGAIPSQDLQKSPTSPEIIMSSSSLGPGPLPTSQSLNNVIGSISSSQLGLPPVLGHQPPSHHHQQHAHSEADRRDSFSLRTSTTSNPNRRPSFVQPSPSTSHRRRRSSVGIVASPPPPPPDDVEGMTRSRKLSLTQSHQESETESELQVMTEPLVGHEDFLVEPNLDTVKENEAVEKFEDEA